MKVEGDDVWNIVKSGLNWTKVGLKDSTGYSTADDKMRLNWTKVGLKANEVVTVFRSPVRLNWTKVGLKDDQGADFVQLRFEFELD